MFLKFSFTTGCDDFKIDEILKKKKSEKFGEGKEKKKNGIF